VLLNVVQYSSTIKCFNRINALIDIILCYNIKHNILSCDRKLNVYLREFNFIVVGKCHLGVYLYLWIDFFKRNFLKTTAETRTKNVYKSEKRPRGFYRLVFRVDTS